VQPPAHRPAAQGSGVMQWVWGSVKSRGNAPPRAG